MLIRILVASLFISSFATAADLRVGVSAVDITPKLCPGKTKYVDFGFMYDKKRDCFNWIHVAGFSPYYPFSSDNRIAQGVQSPIWSRALAVQGENGVTTLLIATDLPGLTWKYVNPIKRRIAKMLAIAYDNITIQALHDHQAPDAAGYWTTFIPGHNQPYTDKLKDWIYLSARQAFASMTQAKMKVVTTTHYSCINRKTRVMKKDPDCNIPQSEYDYKENNDYDDWIVQLDMRDPVVRNTRIVAAQFTRPSGATIATLVNWHNHPELLESSNRLISGDYSHYLREYMEKHLGGTSVFTIGTLGNQIGGLRDLPVPMWNENFERVYDPGQFDDNGDPVPKFVKNGVDKIRSTGYEVASEAVKALNAAGYEENVDVAVHTEEIENPVDNFVHETLTGNVWTWDVEKKDRMVRTWGGRCGRIRGCVKSDVSLIQIGSLSFLTAPGEIDPAYFLGRSASEHDYGGKFGVWKFPAIEGLEGRMPGVHKAMLGQANNYLSYLVPESDNVGWSNTDHPLHYEELVTIGKKFGDDTYRDLQSLLARARNPRCE
ncbi:MAG: neutral/alkaline non-lysosomal ceramidase N-terminal domain-containing protein [Bdellovibrionia bacterium]